MSGHVQSDLGLSLQTKYSIGLDGSHFLVTTIGLAINRLCSFTTPADLLNKRSPSLKSSNKLAFNKYTANN